VPFFGSDWNDNEGSIFAPCRNGSWWLSSKTDKRWNAHGSGMVGGFGMPTECKKKLEKLKKQYGEPPDDLEFGYMKD